MSMIDPLLSKILEELEAILGQTFIPPSSMYVLGTLVSLYAHPRAEGGKYTVTITVSSLTPEISGHDLEGIRLRLISTDETFSKEFFLNHRGQAVIWRVPAGEYQISLVHK